MTKENLIINNRKLVSSIAKRYKSFGEFDDIFQEGVIGLITAAEKFEPDRGYQFSTYATFWIRAEIIKALDNSHLIRKPSYINKEITEI